jgi:hypothetical protein
LGNQANSGITRADFFSAVCWQFCWHSGRSPITLDEVDLTAPPHIVDAARYLAGRGITLSGVTAGKQSVIAYGEAAVDSPGARMSPMTAKVVHFTINQELFFLSFVAFEERLSRFDEPRASYAIA